MSAKVIYFTAGPIATAPELAAIAKLKAVAGAPFDVQVRNALESNSYGYGPEAAAYVAGTRPSAYTSTVTYPPFDPDKPPIPVTSTQKVLNHGDTFTFTGMGGGTISVSIVAGVVTYTRTA